jgi:hypothetical protein
LAEVTPHSDRIAIYLQSDLLTDLYAVTSFTYDAFTVMTMMTHMTMHAAMIWL